MKPPHELCSFERSYHTSFSPWRCRRCGKAACGRCVLQFGMDVNIPPPVVVDGVWTFICPGCHREERGV